jgi:hypothetical protein
VKFPFEIRVRNIGIEDANIEGVPPGSNNNTYIFAGIQIHALNPDEVNSAHVVVGHRGNHPLTVEAKTTNNGLSQVNDIGASAVPLARADLRILGLEDGTIQIFWQSPNLSQDIAQDEWTPYYPNGAFPGNMPKFGDEVVVGLITYAYFDQGLPFKGKADRIDIIEYKAVP